MFGVILSGIINSFKLDKKEKSLCDLKRFTFDCGCKIYSNTEFTKQNFVIECSKHMRQLYDLHSYQSFQKAMDEFFEPEVTIDYYLMRECKTCHLFIDNVKEKLSLHLHSMKHRTSNEIQNPNEVES